MDDTRQPAPPTQDAQADDTSDTSDTSQAVGAPGDGQQRRITHEIARANPERYRILRNGAVYDLQAGRIAGNPPGGTATAITPETSQAMHRRRAELRIQAQAAARSGVATLAGGSEYKAWAEIARAQAKLALDTDKGRSSTEAARFVGQAAGFLASPGSDHTPEPGTSVISDGFMQDVMAILERHGALPDVIDADFSDVHAPGSEGEATE